jgi:hypothetical protein
MQRPRRPPLVSGLFVVVAASVGLLSQEVHLLPPVQVPEVDLLEGDAAVDAVLRQPELVQHIGPAVFRVHLDPSALAGHQGVEQVEVDLLAGEDGRPPERRPATHRESRSGPRAGLVHLPARLVEVVQVPEEPVALLGVRGRILVENFGHSSRVYSAARVIRWRTS